MYVIQASQKEIKMLFPVFKTSFEYRVPSWGVFDLQMNLSLDTKLHLLLPLSKKKIKKNKRKKYILHCPPLPVSLVLFVKYSIHMLAIEIAVLDFSLLINVSYKKIYGLSHPPSPPAIF